MIRLARKLITLIYLKLRFKLTKEKSLSKKTETLRKQREADQERWSAESSLHYNWNERSAILGSYISPYSDIIEFGAGSMFLNSYLKNHRSYTATDLVKRDHESIVCDLNKPILLDLSLYNAAIMSGVLEYVFDIDCIFCALSISNVKEIALSYSCSDIMTENRLANGWLSDYTKTDLIIIFEKYGYSILREESWKKQSLFHLVLSK